MAITKQTFIFTTIAVALAFAYAALPGTVSAQNQPVFKEYKGVAIGAAMTAVREKLGKAKEQSDSEDYFEFDNDETARIIYDDKKIVRAMSINYDGKEKNAPTPETILGKQIKPRDDGGMSEMIQYPKSGFWISYVRTGGDSPLVIVTIQKM
jgi:hypothetical protein